MNTAGRSGSGLRATWMAAALVAAIFFAPLGLVLAIGGLARAWSDRAWGPAAVFAVAGLVALSILFLPAWVGPEPDG